MASAPSTTPLRQQQQEQSYGDDPDRDNTETDSLSSETDSLSSETDSLGSEVIPDAPAHTHEAHGKSVYHGIKVRFQEGVVSRLDGARLDALVEVGEHKGTKDVVVVRYLMQRFDALADYLRLEQESGCYVLRCVSFQEVEICEELFWAFSETWRWRVYSTISEKLVKQYYNDVIKDRCALQPLQY